MVKTVIASVLAVTSFVFVSSAYAVGNDNLRVKNNENVMERVENRQMVASKVAQLRQVQKERVRKSFSTLISRNEAAIARINKLITRMEARIAWVDQNDKEIDTAVAKSDIQKAKTAINTAERLLTEVKADFEALLESTTPIKDFAEIKQGIKDVKISIVEAHRLLVHALGDIKGQRVGATGNEE